MNRLRDLQSECICVHLSVRSPDGLTVAEREKISQLAIPRGREQALLDRCVKGKMNWSARYLKLVDCDENTIRFWQEIFDEHGVLVEVHQKYPIDLGHRRRMEQDL